MKKATEYGLKIKRMLPSLKKRFIAPPPEDLQPLEVFVVGVLREGSTLPTAMAALRLMQEEFVDFNEIRVAPPKDIMDMLANDMPDLRAKAEQITAGLNRIFDHENRLDFEHAADMGKRDLQTHLRESLGFSSFVEAYLLLYLFGHRAMPVDARLVDRLKADGLVHPESTVDDVRVLLERVVSPKAQAEAFEMLAQYAQQPIKIAKKKAKAKRAGKAAAKEETEAGEMAVPKTAAQEPSRTTTKEAGPKKASKAAAKAKKTKKAKEARK